jgi:phosphate transport system substrate-binding protein
MIKIGKFLFLGLIAVCLVTCNKSKQATAVEESILKGSATILVDETLTPIMDDQVAVFESKYDAKINIVSKSETELILLLFQKNCNFG